jgi:phosphatidylinositol glycan class O
VDALRFDFALEHLPNSVGARLAKERRLEANVALQREKRRVDSEGGISNDGGLALEAGNGMAASQPVDSDITHDQVLPRGQSQLYQFVADPPTVTMQRLKGLTTGGLPTFADISGSFGGANVDEDSWVQQLHDVPISRRGISIAADINADTAIKSNHATDSVDLHRKVKMAFVGDDTWVDLFPTQFDDSHPYPSFNTRDLDSVDDGCLLHLPRLLQSFGSKSLRMNAEMKNSRDNLTYIELLVTHFLGVDHVGHTYGSHNE